MTNFKIHVGLNASKEQQSLIAFALLRTAGVTLTSFMELSASLAVFEGSLAKEHGRIVVECNTFSDLNSEQARHQIVRLVLLQLGVSDISLGEFETAVRNNFEPVK